MEPPKDESAALPGVADDSGQPGQGTPGGDTPITQPSEPAVGTAAVEPTPPPPVAPTPVVPMLTDHTVEQLPAPEAYGNIEAIMPLVTSTPPVPGKSGSGKKKLLIAAGVGVATLLVATGAVFGLYLPNTQGNVWNTGINRSGEALDHLVQTASAPDKLKSYTSSNIKGTLKATVAGGTYSGTLNTSFDKTSLDAALDVALKGDGVDETMSAKVISKISTGSVYPDIYVQVVGLKALGLDDFVPGISAYDSKWIKIDSAYLKSLGDSYLATEDNTKTQVTADDVAEMARTASGVTKEYLFSTAPDKAVFVKQGFVGKEHVDGLTAYHYKVGINKQHLQAYCEAISNAVLSTDGYRKASGLTATEISNLKKDAVTECKSAGDEIKSTDTFDMWIDGHYKLIYKIRVYEQGSTTAYTDIGQLYKGGDKLSLFAAFHDGSDGSDGKLTIDTDLQTSATDATLTMKQTGGDIPYDITATLDATGSSKPVQVTLPTGATPVQDVLKKIGLGGSILPPASTTDLRGSTPTNDAPLRSL